jgi:hypothetical protein
LRMYFVKSSGTCELSSLIAWRTKMIKRINKEFHILILTFI